MYRTTEMGFPSCETAEDNFRVSREANLNGNKESFESKVLK